MYFHNSVAKSKATLPLSVAYTIIAFLCAGVWEDNLWLTALTTFAIAWMAELINIRNVLIRGYSRLTACLVLLLSLVTMHITPAFSGAIMLLLFALYLFVILQAYQKRRAPSVFFTAYLFLGLISLIDVQVLFFVPFLLVMNIIWLQAPSSNNLLASLFGLALPYFFWGAYILFTQEPSLFVAHFEGFVTFGPICGGLLEPHLLVAILILLALDFLSIAHYLRYSFDENIKNRMLHFTLFAISLLAFLFLILQPQHKELLLRIALLTTSMTTAHFFTFSKERSTSYVFLAFVILILAATVVMIWKF